MDQPKATNDASLDRLYAVTAKLDDRLMEAADVRARFTKARDANVWPDLGSLSRLLTDNDRER
jgi:hypothetical protein